MNVPDIEQAHWAFYSFREDRWDAMDFELGKSKVPSSYWQEADRQTPETLQRHNTPDGEGRR